MAYVPPHRRRAATAQAAAATPEDEKQPRPPKIPTILLGATTPPDAASSSQQSLWEALSTVGCAVVEAPDVLAPCLCEKALAECARIMKTENGRALGVKKERSRLRAGHRRSDHKDSLMLRIQHLRQNEVLGELWRALQIVKYRVLNHLEARSGNLVGLCSCHRPETDSMRLLYYPGIKDRETAKALKAGNRCFAHVDYGTITLLLADRAGLEVEVDQNTWVAVPHKPGTLAVTVGKEMAQDASHELKAVLHRVPGPESDGSALVDTSSERHSIALFVQKELYSDSAGAGKKTPRQKEICDGKQRINNGTASAPTSPEVARA